MLSWRSKTKSCVKWPKFRRDKNKFWCVTEVSLRRLSVCLLKNTLHTIYKSFARLHLDYGDIFYDKSDNQNFESKIGKIQYKAFIAITGAIQEASRKILYDELRLMSLKESE